MIFSKSISNQPFFFSIVEASHLLDLKQLMGKTPPNTLIPLSKKHGSLLQRFPDNLGLLLTIIVFLTLIYKWMVNPNDFVVVLFAIVILLIFVQKNRIKGMYGISEKGFVIPYTWLTQKRIDLKSIVEIRYDKLIEKDTNSEIDGIQIVIDHPVLKFNTTGIQDSNIVLTSSNYDKTDLEVFAEEFNKYKRKYTGKTSKFIEEIK